MNIRAWMILMLLLFSVFNPGSIVFAKDISERHTVEFSADEQTIVQVKNINGDIYVDSWEYDFISLDYVLTTQQEYGKDEFKKVEIRSNETENILLIETVYLQDIVHVTVDMTLRIPYFVNIEIIETDVGSITVYDLDTDQVVRSSLTVRTEDGDIYLNDIIIDEGNLSLSSSIGDLSVYGASIPEGCFSVDTETGDISIYDVSFGLGCFTVDSKEGYIYCNDIVVPEGDLHLSTGNGDLSVYGAVIPNGGIYLDTENGDITVYETEFTTPGLTLNNPNGDIYLNDVVVPAGDLKLTTSDATISLYDIMLPNGDVYLTSEYGDLSAHNVVIEQGDLSLFTTSGDLSTYSVSIPNGEIHLSTGSGDVSLHDLYVGVEGVKAHTEGGYFYLHHVTLLEGDVSLETTSGDISVYSSEVPNGSISLKTLTGDVSIMDTSFQVGGLSIDTSDKGQIYLNDLTIPDGDVNLSTTRGDISVYDVSVPNGALVLFSEDGDFTVYGASFSEWQFTTNNGDIYLNELIFSSGDLSLSTIGDITVYDVSVIHGGIFLETPEGDISVHNVLFDDWMFDTINGDLYLSGFTITEGDFELSTTGDISVYDIVIQQGILTIDTEQGDISVGTVIINEEDLFLSTEGDIFVYDTNAYVQASSIKGDIYVENTTGIHDLITEKGSIFVEINDLKNDVTISTVRGNIKIVMKPDLKATIDMKIDSIIGRIFLTNMRSLLDITQLSAKQVQATLGGGGNKITVSIGDEENPNDLLGGFITIKKVRTKLFSLFPNIAL